MAEIDKLFENVESEILSEDVKLELAVLFESQVTEAIKAKEESLIEENAKEVSAFKETLVQNLDLFCEHFCDNFIKENKQVIADSVKLKTAQRVLATFDSVMKDFSYQLDEKKIDVEDKLTESKKEINKLTKELIDSKQKVKDVEKAVLVLEASSSLETDLQKSKLVEYAKNLPFDELFEKKTKAFTKTLIEESIQLNKDEKGLEKLVMTEEIVPEVKSKSATDIEKYLAAMK